MGTGGGVSPLSLLPAGLPAPANSYFLLSPTFRGGRGLCPGGTPAPQGRHPFSCSVVRRPLLPFRSFLLPRLARAGPARLGEGQGTYHTGHRHSSACTHRGTGRKFNHLQTHTGYSGEAACCSDKLTQKPTFQKMGLEGTAGQGWLFLPREVYSGTSVSLVGEPPPPPLLLPLRSCVKITCTLHSKKSTTEFPPP